MKLIRSIVHGSITAIASLLVMASLLHAQSNSSADPDSRRGAGLRAGVWNVPGPAIVGTTYKRLPQAAIFFQRGLDEHVVLESSIAAWSRRATRTELSGNQVETDTYVFPLFTTLEIYPFTTLDQRVEPFIGGGLGFALGLDAVGTNAIGGGGTTIVTAFGFQGNAGVDVHLARTLSVQATARYQWLEFGEPLGGSERYAGLGFEGGLIYRLQF